MIRTILSSCALFATVTSAHAYTPIEYREVPELVGKQVYAAANLEISPKIWLFAGEPVTLGKCDKSTATIRRLDKTTVVGWKYTRCAIRASDNRGGAIPIESLSRTALKFDLHDPGTPAALRRAAFDEAFDTVLAMVKFAKAHGDEMSPEQITGKVDGAGVLGEYAAEWRGLAAAWDFARTLHGQMVDGSRMTTDSAMRMPQYKWAVKASDADMLRAWTKGAETAADRKRFEAGSSCLSKLNQVSSWGVLPQLVADQLAAKQWRQGVTDVSPQQLDALDKENEGKLNKRLADSETSFRKRLGEAEAMRKTLKW